MKVKKEKFQRMYLRPLIASPYVIVVDGEKFPVYLRLKTGTRTVYEFVVKVNESFFDVDTTVYVEFDLTGPAFQRFIKDLTNQAIVPEVK